MLAALLNPMLPTLAVTTAILAFERWRGAPPTDWRINLQSWAAQLFIAITLLPLLPVWRGASLIDGARLPFWAGFPILLLVRDFGEYIFHRAQHRVPLLWAMHSLHHSDPEMAVLTTQRHFWGDQLVKQVTIWSAVVMIIRPTPALLGAYGVVSLWNLMSHADLRLDFGRWSWLINSPAYHRRHHSMLPEHYDSNFAALFPIFDVIFGSYYRPDGFPPTGQDHAPRNFVEMVAWPWLVGRSATVPTEAAQTA